MTYRWKNNPRRAELYGRPCLPVCFGAMNSVLIEMTDTGERIGA